MAQLPGKGRSPAGVPRLSVLHRRPMVEVSPHCMDIRHLIYSIFFSGGSGVGGAQKIESRPIGSAGRARVSRARRDRRRGRKGLGKGSKYHAGLSNPASRRSFMEAGGGWPRRVHLVNGMVFIL